MKQLNTNDTDFWQSLDGLLAWEGVSDDAVNNTVRDIIADIRSRGDEALVEFTNRFDRMSAKDISELEIPVERLQAALDGLPAE